MMKIKLGILGAGLALLGASSALGAPGDADSSFRPYTAYPTDTIMQAPDKRIILNGNFGREDQPLTCLARVSLDGVVDESFAPEYIERLKNIAITGDGNVVAAGNLNIYRVLSTGQGDAGYNGTGIQYTDALFELPNGKVMVGGRQSPYLRRLLANGTVDSTFSSPSAQAIYTMALQQDGALLIGGLFGSVGNSQRAVVRISSSGAVDNTFTCAFTGGASVRALAVQRDGKILIAGYFTNIHGTSRVGLARLNPNGTLDTAFTPTVPNDSIRGMVVQADGKILIGGDFTSVNGVARTFLARLNPDGTLDTTLVDSIPFYSSHFVNGISLQSDGRILLGGYFVIPEADTAFAARFLNDPATETLSATTSRIQWLRGGTAPETQWVSFAVSTDGVTYTTLNSSASATRINGGWELTGLNLPANAAIRARATITGGLNNGSTSYHETFFNVAPEIDVTGNTISIADGDTSPSATDHTEFGSVPVALGTISRTFTIQNLGTDILNLGTVTVGGTHAADFTVTQQPAPAVTLLPPTNVPTTFTVRFDPSASGSRTAILSFANNDANENPFNFTIRGTGTVPEIVVTGNGVNIVDGDTTPSTADHTDFGTVNIYGSNSQRRVFTITNTGTAPLTVSNVTLSGSGVDSYSVIQQPTSPVAAGESTTFEIKFDPTLPGVSPAAVNFTTNDTTEGAYNFSITGTGQYPEIALTGNGTNLTDGDTSPSAADHTDFGAVPVTSGSVQRTFTITNTGTMPLGITGVTISGAHAEDFTVTQLPGASVAQNGGTTQLRVTFTPRVAGVRTATVSIANDDMDESPFDFSIQGAGLDPDVVVSGNGVNIVNGDTTPSLTDHTDFGPATHLKSGGTRTFTLANIGTETLTRSIVTVSGPNASDFSISQYPSLHTAPNSSSTFKIGFIPAELGARTATITIEFNDADDSSFSFNVQGTGVRPEITVTGNGANIADGYEAAQTANHTDFGGVNVSGATLVRTFTITNPGSAPLTVDSVSVSSMEAANFTVLTQPTSPVAPGGDTTFQISFAPSVIGLARTQVLFSTNVPAVGTFSFYIQGTGLDPDIRVSGNSITINNGDTTPSLADSTDFGNVSKMGGSLEGYFYIYNTGTAALTITGAVTVSGAHASDFTVTTQPATSVAPNTSTPLRVTFRPSASGLRTATLSFNNNDPDESPFTFSIQGNGTEPEINVTGNGYAITSGDTTPRTDDHTDFGSVSTASGTLVRTFRIANTGNATLTINGTMSVIGTHYDDFKVTTAPATPVEPGGSTTFQVTFDPTGNGLRGAILVFANNDGDEGSYTFSVQGTGLSGLQTWRQTNFSTTLNTGNAANDHDFEKDGLPNIVEFGFGLNPKSGLMDSSLLPNASINAQGRLVLTFIRRKASTFPGISYSVQTGPSLDVLAPLSLTSASVTSIDSALERVTITDPVVTPNRFGKVVITEP